MKNPNAPLSRVSRSLKARWSREDYPGGEPRFQIKLFLRDLLILVVPSLVTVAGVKAVDGSSAPTKRHREIQRVERGRYDTNQSQIITFSDKPFGRRGGAGLARSYSSLKRSPGSLVRLRLLNVVETYSTAPVHAQVIDSSLGDELKGGTLIGDANPDATYERISIQFRYARDPNRDSVALPITARALSLDGTLGINAEKKEGFVARSAIGSAATGSQDLQRSGQPGDLQAVLLKALTAGLFQELGSGSQVERNRAQVLTLKPQTEFFAELTDFFPTGAR